MHMIADNVKKKNIFCLPESLLHLAFFSENFQNNAQNQFLDYKITFGISECLLSIDKGYFIF